MDRLRDRIGNIIDLPQYLHWIFMLPIISATAQLARIRRNAFPLSLAIFSFSIVPASCPFRWYQIWTFLFYLPFFANLFLAL